MTIKNYGWQNMFMSNVYDFYSTSYKVGNDP